MTTRVVVLKGTPITKEALASGALTPGELLERASATQFQAHSTAGGNAAPLFADINPEIGRDIGDNYTSGDQVKGAFAYPGRESNALVAAAASAIAVDDYLESNGDGTLRIHDAASPAEGLLTIGTLLLSGAAAEKFKTTTTMLYKINNAQFSKAATDNLVFTAANTINTGAATGVFYGAWKLGINAAGTVITYPAAGLADQVYASAALALAAMVATAVAADVVPFGSIVVGANTGVDWVANTDDMTNASDCLTAAFADLDALAAVASHYSEAIVARAMEAVDNSAGGSEARIKVEVV